jgi:hypothetical protein
MTKVSLFEPARDPPPGLGMGRKRRRTDDARTQQPTGRTVDPTIRLRLATRIHFALLRHYGEDVAVSTLLQGEGDAREALWVCDASGDAELVNLARQFRAAPRPMPVIEAPTPAPQDMAWARDTSGFGVSRLPVAPAAPAPQGGRWRDPRRWLRAGGAAR